MRGRFRNTLSTSGRGRERGPLPLTASSASGQMRLPELGWGPEDVTPGDQPTERVQLHRTRNSQNLLAMPAPALPATAPFSRGHGHSQAPSGQVHSDSAETPSQH